MTDDKATDEHVNLEQTDGEDSLTIGTWSTGLVLGIALFALAYHFGALDSFITTWTPANHQSARDQLEWN